MWHFFSQNLAAGLTLNRMTCLQEAKSLFLLLFKTIQMMSACFKDPLMESMFLDTSMLLENEVLAACTSDIDLFDNLCEF